MLEQHRGDESSGGNKLDWIEEKNQQVFGKVALGVEKMPGTVMVENIFSFRKFLDQCKNPELNAIRLLEELLHSQDI